MDELIKIKCPTCGAVLAVKNKPGLENKNITCPVCKQKNPFSNFEIIPPKTEKVEEAQELSSPKTEKEEESKDELIKIKCPTCGAVLAAKNKPDLENKIITCPVCKQNNPFTDFKTMPSQTEKEEDNDYWSPKYSVINGYQIQSVLDKSNHWTFPIYKEYETLEMVEEPRTFRLLTMKSITKQTIFPNFDLGLCFKNQVLKYSKINHPNIIKIIDFFESNNTYYWITDHYNKNLHAIIKAEGCLSVSKSLKTIKSIGQAVEYLHKNNIQGVNITPHNIYFTENNEPILSSLGIEPIYTKYCVDNDEDVIPSRDYYFYDEDIYALGAVLYYMLTGKKPSLPDDEHKSELKNKGVSDEVISIIKKAMSRKKEDFQTVSEFLEAIDKAESLEIEVVEIGSTNITVVKDSEYSSSEYISIGTIVKDYQILSIPDRSLYKVRHIKTNRVLAMTEYGGGGSIWEAPRLKKQAIEYSKISHPNFINIMDVFAVHYSSNDKLCIITEYYDRNLHSIIEAEGSMSESKSLEIIKSIGQAVEQLHNRDIFHLDITPHNIYFADNGEPVLTGFGKETYQTLSYIEDDVTFFPPINGCFIPYHDFHCYEPIKLSPTIDIYALGATLNYMLAGKEPLVCNGHFYYDSENSAFFKKFPDDLLIAKSVSNEVISIIKKAMSPQKEDRYQTVSEFLEAIEEAESVEEEIVEASDPGFHGVEKNVNALPIGTELKGFSYTYIIQKVLGQGSFGITYLASVKLAGALGAIDANISVAIKEFFMRDINGRSDTNVTSVTSGNKDGIYNDYKRKFIREAKNLSKLNHPNIIKVIEAFEANDTVYFAMEYIMGGSLDDQIKRKGCLTGDEATRLARQIGSALAFMHNKGMLHLDLKPANVMIRENGDAVLIDFGLSKQYDENGEPETSTKVGGGTPGYAPIEQTMYREGNGFPVTMDVYALGGTLFKMLTGKRPPEAPEILNEGFPDYELKAQGVSDSLTACIEKAMSPMKRGRYQTVEKFLTALYTIAHK